MKRCLPNAAVAGMFAFLAPVTLIAAEPVRFNRDIRPIMADTCFKCHGPAKHEAGLRLDGRDQATKAAESGETPIVPGEPDKSELVRRIFAADESERMPPPEARKTLTAEQKDLLKRWVAEGAQYEKHWSFEPVRRPA
ncbi:MAG TPA: c-type cytochrome domain-containing protein, partial [Pirellulaceae bacterium]|nr:c-type cytochrome domain-containing protein [Pirellulaceae bacterium]